MIKTSATTSVFNTSLLHAIDYFSQEYITQHRFGINQDKKESPGGDK